MSLRSTARTLLALAGAALVLCAVGGAAALDPPHAVGDGVVDTPLEEQALHDSGGVTDGDGAGAAAVTTLQQHPGPGGHLPGSSLNVELVGQLTVSGIVPGRISDVGALGNYAYLGAFNAPCAPDGQGGGVYVVDISNPASPAEVGFIPTKPGSFVGEGVQAISIDTKSFEGDILVINNEICDLTGMQIGGFSIFDVTNPLKPVALVEGAGDPTPSLFSDTNQIHSAFAWQQGKNAYVVIVDDEEEADVDIFDITNPAAPTQVAEVGLANWPGAQNSQSEGIGGFAASFHHDVVVKQVRGDWLMLVSYWDAGYIVLNVNDPANPVFVGDTDFTDPDPETGTSPPEGNAHEAEWNQKKSKFILAADEDFSPSQITSFTSNAFPGSRPASEGTFTPTIVSMPGSQMTGEVVHVGRGCPGVDTYLADPSGKIALIERGLCRFDAKIAGAQQAGATGVIVYNSAAGGEGLVAMGGENPVAEGDPSVIGTVISIPAIFVQRSTGLLLVAGTPPVTTTTVAQFNGWGYLHLFDARTLEEIDTHAIREALSPAFLRTVANPFGFGDLSIHEVTTDPHRSLAYVSHYAGGFRVLRFGASGLKEVGHYVDANGNNFWGIQAHTLPDDANGDAKGQNEEDEQTLALASDRDSGLWIFRYTGD